jgi:hypothetical protein
VTVAPPQPSGGDDTTALNQWRAQLPANADIDFGGRAYQAEGTLVGLPIPDLHFANCTVHADTDGHTMPAWDGKTANWPRHRAHWRFAGDIRPQLDRLTVVGPNLRGVDGVNREEGWDRSAQAAFQLSGCDHPRLTDCLARFTYGDAVTLSDRTIGATIAHLDAAKIGRQGVAVTDADETTIEGCIFDGCAHSGIDIEPWREQTVRGVTIRGCTFANVRYAIGGAGSGKVVEDILVEDCHALSGPFLAKIGSPNRVTRNVTFRNCTGGPGSLILHQNVEGLVVENCPGFDVRDAADTTPAGKKR